MERCHPAVVTFPIIPLFDREPAHPSVPTWRPGSTARRGGQVCPQGTAKRRAASLTAPSTVLGWRAGGPGGFSRGKAASVGQSAVGMVAGQTAGAVEDGEPAIGILMDPDLALDVMVTMAVGRDLKHAPLVAHGVVVAHHAFLLDAQDVGEITPGHEGTAGLARRGSGG